jgi:Zn-dependent peptidase ImmA (M78 family)
MVDTVPVNPEVLTWALDRSGINRDVIQRAVPRLPLWLDRSAEPTRRQLETFAKKTLTPLGYLFLPKPPEEPLPVPDFRTKPRADRKRPSPNLLETIYILQSRQDWLSEYFKETDQPSAAFMVHETDSADVATTAAAIRAKLGLAGGWAAEVETWQAALDFLRDAAQNGGVFTFINSMVGNNVYRKLDPDEFRGFVLPDKYAPMVFLNGADSKSAQMFTLAHELAHLWINVPGIFDLPHFQPSAAEVETRCNRIAAEFLVPAAELRRAWPEAERRSDPISYLARRFKVSPIVAALRAADLRFIERATFDDLFDNSVRAGRRAASSGGSFYNNQNLRVGKRFARIVMHAAKSGRLLFRDAYRLTGLYGATFDNYAKRLGVEF